MSSSPHDGAANDNDSGSRSQDNDPTHAAQPTGLSEGELRRGSVEDLREYGAA